MKHPKILYSSTISIRSEQFVDNCGWKSQLCRGLNSIHLVFNGFSCMFLVFVYIAIKSNSFCRLFASGGNICSVLPLYVTGLVGFGSGWSSDSN